MGLERYRGLCGFLGRLGGERVEGYCGGKNRGQVKVCVECRGRSSLNGLVVFPTFFNLSLNLASFNFMASVTICSDFGAQKNKV